MHCVRDLKQILRNPLVIRHDNVQVHRRQRTFVPQRMVNNEQKFVCGIFSFFVIFALNEHSGSFHDQIFCHAASFLCHFDESFSERKTIFKRCGEFFSPPSINILRNTCQKTSRLLLLFLRLCKLSPDKCLMLAWGEREKGKTLLSAFDDYLIRLQIKVISVNFSHLSQRDEQRMNEGNISLDLNSF